MRKLGALTMSVISFLSITFGFSIVGLFAGSFIGEEYFFRSKEPMIEMLFGGLIGIVIGVGMGLTASVWIYNKIGQGSVRESHGH